MPDTLWNARRKLLEDTAAKAVEALLDHSGGAAVMIVLSEGNVLVAGRREAVKGMVERHGAD